MFENADHCDIAWVAGIFEGEGCISRWIKPSGRIQPVVSIHMTDKDIVDRFDEIVGTGSRYLDKRPYPRQLCYIWRIQDIAGVKEFIDTIWSYLGERRRARAIELGLHI